MNESVSSSRRNPGGLSGELRPQAEEVASLLKALAHADRLMLLCEMAGGRHTVSELALSCGISQSQTSQFLSRLRSEGWVSPEREGQQVFYQLADPRVGTLLVTLKELFCKPASKGKKK
jgi:ArsR family transcriptional regulator